MRPNPIVNTGTVIMAGMPKTGKSTFLGALYHVLETGAESAIRLDVLPAARQHLEGLRKRWLRVEPEDRTSKASPVLNDLMLRTDEKAALLSLRWPDLSGEYFDDMVRNRTLNAEVAKILEEATALLMFVHPDTVTQQPRIHDVNRAATGAGSEEDGPAKGEGRSDAREAEQIEWNPMMVPGQVLVVELLQMLLDYHLANRISKISIVLSAWDVVPRNVQSPKEYVRAHLPLLHQFIKANEDRYQIKAFGVSALGGDAHKDKEVLQAKIEPAHRIQVVDEGGAAVADGILAPLRWLIE